MTELKTLKDIQNKIPCGKDILRVSSYDLKKEAVKWVKEIQPAAMLNIEDVRKNTIAQWIIIFFNLTEGDLK